VLQNLWNEFDCQFDAFGIDAGLQWKFEWLKDMDASCHPDRNALLVYLDHHRMKQYLNFFETALMQ
jgi:hypothetical protein